LWVDAICIYVDRHLIKSCGNLRVEPRFSEGFHFARTSVRRYFDQNRLAANIFFSRGGRDVSHAGKFVTSIAVQLAGSLQTLEQHIYNAISEDTKIASKSLRGQWIQLIVGPLSQLSARSVPLSFLIVIDALDECEGGNDIRSILQLLAETNALRTARLQFLLPSRPETPIIFGFRAMPGIIHHGGFIIGIIR
jgi:hypothetical protein